MGKPTQQINPVNNFSDVPYSLCFGFDMGVHTPPQQTYTPPNHNSVFSYSEHTRIRPVPSALEVLVIFYFILFIKNQILSYDNTYMHTYELKIFTIENNEIL